MDFRGAQEYLDSFANYERTRSFEYPEAFDLSRMRSLAKELGNPQNAYDSVLIAGSKGKGSTAAYLSSILRMEDVKVGLYTSPHLLSVCERICINGIPISEARFVESALELRRITDAAEWRRDPPTYFEVLTAMAFKHFKDLKVRWAVIEVGLGGLYDSTNIAPAKAAAITPIGLEHTDLLGKTIPKIAVQKAGIIKGRELVVSAPQVREAEKVLQDACREREAELVMVGRETQVQERWHDEREQAFDVRTPYGDSYDLRTTLLGEHQIENAAVAVTLARGLEERARFKVSEAAIKQGVAAAVWPGRLERVSEAPVVLLDGAHTPDSMRRLLVAVKRHFEGRVVRVVLGLSRDKDAAAILGELRAEVAQVVVTEASSPRALPARELAEAARAAGLEPELHPDPERALAAAIASASPDDVVLVTGSLFLVADVQRLLPPHRMFGAV
ncbi:MAG: Folylpolyglutamate synthase [Candidatus Omnitrophica bacterium]|nr:Folylpolyglutamate synthase [Candidatus Omnitrophota bacterium]